MTKNLKQKMFLSPNNIFKINGLVWEITPKGGNSGKYVIALSAKDIAKSWKWAFCNPQQ